MLLPLVPKGGSMPEGGTSIYEAYRDMALKWVSFSQKILRHGSAFTPKNPQIWVPIFKKNSRKQSKHPCFQEKSLDMRKIVKKHLNQPFLEVKKSLDMGRGFRTLAAGPCQNIIRVPPPGILILVLYQSVESIRHMIRKMHFAPMQCSTFTHNHACLNVKKYRHSKCSNMYT